MAKQLSLPERYVIERMLHQDYSFASIGRNLDRSASTIAREVLHYRCFTSRIPIMGENDCINRPSCQRNTLCHEMGVHGCFASRCKRCPEGIICTSICDNYDSFQCDLLDKPPYVCSNCKIQEGCKKNKAYCRKSFTHSLFRVLLYRVGSKKLLKIKNTRSKYS